MRRLRYPRAIWPTKLRPPRFDSTSPGYHHQPGHKVEERFHALASVLQSIELCNRGQGFSSGTRTSVSSVEPRERRAYPSWICKKRATKSQTKRTDAIVKLDRLQHTGMRRIAVRARGSVQCSVLRACIPKRTEN